MESLSEFVNILIHLAYSFSLAFQQLFVFLTRKIMKNSVIIVNVKFTYYKEAFPTD